MEKRRKKPDLQHESLKQHPFSVPEGYFESFSGRLQERIRQEEASEVPVRRIGTSTRLRVAMAAAVVMVALISYSVIRFTLNNRETVGSYSEFALLEELYLLEDERILMGVFEEEEQAMDEEEAFALQAIEYLAINDVEMDLIFE